ncbi:unnamed protein product [Prunus armeniaca]|uniref:Uncharacterized protein n=1 Tax=Prunus armeniaca TaxID=36596 RepID=A0A6J5W3Y2_PRUAR|nr:unnamed protein product [Prunus armeniaca]
MALRATNNWRSMLVRLGENRAFATSTAPKMKPITQNLHASEPTGSTFRRIRKFLTKPENAPVAIVLGFITVPIIIGLHSLKQQLMHAPSVVFDKKKRESVFEVEQPDVAVSSSDRFINKSFLRKVGRIQDPGNPTMPDPVQRDAFTRPRTAETLKTAGVDPSRR